jgi:hypothetical protein
MPADTTLEKENAALNQEIKQLKTSDYQERFHTIFEFSRLANKIIAPDLQIIEVNAALNVPAIISSAHDDLRVNSKEYGFRLSHLLIHNPKF